VREQRLDLVGDDGVVASYPVSTSRFGSDRRKAASRRRAAGLKSAKKLATVFPAAQFFAVAFPRIRRSAATNDDLVLTRILWLDGLEEHNANTRDRFIYIHGTNHEEAIGQPASHGCIRMKNADLIALFDRIRSERKS
jgi:hypothetical protein